MPCPVHPTPDHDTRYLDEPEPTAEEVAAAELAEAEAHTAGTCSPLCGICAADYERSQFATEAEYLAHEAAYAAHCEAELQTHLASCTCRKAVA